MTIQLPGLPPIEERPTVQNIVVAQPISEVIALAMIAGDIYANRHNAQLGSMTEKEAVDKAVNVVVESMLVMTQGTVTSRFNAALAFLNRDTRDDDR